MKRIADWSPSSDIRVLAVDGEDGRWVVSGEASAACACPDCQQPSRVRHGRYSRDLQDLPAQGQPVVIRVSVQRWRWRNALCRRQTFGSRMPEAAGFAARRTRRVTDVAGCLGHAVGGRPAQRLTARLGLTTSRDTILRALKRAQGSAPGALRVVGIDDWSWRKGSTYGTLIMDLERRQVVDLLPDRRADTTARWLGARPENEVVSRDRCGLYAVAATQGAPQARQVADRFHLIQNLRDVIERQLSRGTTRMAAPLSSGAEPPANRVPDHPPPARLSATALHRNAGRDARRPIRVAQFVRVKKLADNGLSLNDIVRETGFNWRSVSKWSSMEVLAPRQRASPKHPTLAAYDEHLSARWASGTRHGVALLVEIRAMGYSGSRASFYRLLAVWKHRDRNAARCSSAAPDRGVEDQAAAELPVSAPEPIDPATGHLISPIAAAALCIKPRRAEPTPSGQGRGAESRLRRLRPDAPARDAVPSHSEAARSRSAHAVDRPGSSLRPSRHEAIRPNARRRLRRSPKRRLRALEQRAGGGTHQPPKDDQAIDVRPRRGRSPPGPPTAV